VKGIKSWKLVIVVSCICVGFAAAYVLWYREGRATEDQFLHKFFKSGTVKTIPYSKYTKDYNAGTWTDKELLQEFLKSKAEDMRKNSKYIPNYPPNDILGLKFVKRRDRAIVLLGNGVFDNEVVLLVARIDPPTGMKYSHPTRRDYPSLNWYVVDELDQTEWVCYSDSNDPNAFGTKLFNTSDYYRMSRFNLRPKLFWCVPLYCMRDETIKDAQIVEYIGENGPRGYVQLNVDVNTWNALLSNRGQLILRDKQMNCLDRINLGRLPYQISRDILKNLKVSNR